MKRNILSFTVGAVLTIAAVYADGFHASLWTFLAGALCPLLILLVWRIRPQKRRVRQATKPLASLPQVSPLVADVAQALVGLGVHRKQAERVAAESHRAYPQASVPELLRISINGLRRANTTA